MLIREHHQNSIHAYRKKERIDDRQDETELMSRFGLFTVTTKDLD